ncbi:hypothetical protein Bca52824_065753 [Brassica carinata]|uniref:Uncharacterized protein n=1 Tax=Brassica carinata TaxID=52824 RepID=A0A8X7QK84_BRACI|nr:hypothetical protein Bca52824_065753 [Brassica carinata]
MYMRRQIFTNAFTNRGMKAGPSGVVSVPMTDTPRVDCDQLAETCRYLKAKLCRGKFPCGDNLGKTVATHQIGGCEEDAEYNPLSAGTESYLRTEAVYHPMEKRSHDDVFGNANTDETLQIDRGSGSKRKRDDYVRDMSSVVMYPVCEMKSNVGDLEKQGKVLYTDCKVDKVGDSVTSSVVVMNSNIKVEESKASELGFSAIDLTGIGVPEDGQKMISEFMSMYNRNVQSNQNQTSMVMETQLLQPTVQNHQEHLQFQGKMVEGSFFEDLNIPNRINNQMFFQGNNNNSGFKYDTAHTNNNNFEAAHNNASSNRFQLVFDSPPFDRASFDYRDNMSMPVVVGTMDGMQQQKQQDVSIWFL